ncbi:MAG: alpha-glucan family phosphorylase [Deltaproteobacteria bacterium]|nr:alpha-glucan family phosphorylase [Deltaproteobacteria bacterium]
MNKIKRFVVSPDIPKRLEGLKKIAYNIWWSWNIEAIHLFRSIDVDLWEECHHNPVKMLGLLSAENYRNLVTDEVFMARVDRILEDLEEYLEAPTWFAKNYPDYQKVCIAYFTFEAGFHESLPLYSGGLGILSAEHLKSASELGVPLVSVSILYKLGYFQQYLNQDGWQMESYPENDYFNMPLTLETKPDGTPLFISIDYPGRKVYAQIWRMQVGRVPHFLLDANVEMNSPDDREITYQLYGGDNEMRIKQEILLGIGGTRALKLMGYDPMVCHMNEGHSGFLSLERVNMLVQDHGLKVHEAREIVKSTNVFTTHTPVPAGIDVFPVDLIRKYFTASCQAIGIDIEELIAFGRENPDDPNSPFNMAVLSFRMSYRINGVSKLHGQVSRRTWKHLWPGVPEDEVPIKHVTNGVHTKTWLSDEMKRMYDRYLGTRWLDEPDSGRVWERVDKIPDAELWRTHERLRERLVYFVRRQLARQLKARGLHHTKVSAAEEVFDPDALTIGFARRFARYKRATLLFTDPERLDLLVNNPSRPVQFIFAGKAHPQDNPGKDLIKQLIHTSSSDTFRHRIVFLENYDIEIARYMIQGVDIWLNNPRRPMEASGTSGMKGPINGGINLSVLDGWWDESYNGKNGWTIGNGEEYANQTEQDGIESLALYEILEKEVVPMFYQRDEAGIPRRWTAMMKESMRSVVPVFNTDRMLIDYLNMFYIPALQKWERLTSDNYDLAKDLVYWRNFIKDQWGKVKVLDVKTEADRILKVGGLMVINAVVELGEINPWNVAVEVYYGKVDAQAYAVTNAQAMRMEWQKEVSPGQHLFTLEFPLTQSGETGFNVRVLPARDILNHKFDTGHITWW